MSKLSPEEWSDEQLFRAASHDNDAFSVLCASRLNILIDLVWELCEAHGIEATDADVYEIAQRSIFGAVEWVNSNGYEKRISYDHRWMKAFVTLEVEEYFSAFTERDFTELMTQSALMDDIVSLIPEMPAYLGEPIYLTFERGYSLEKLAATLRITKAEAAKRYMDALELLHSLIKLNTYGNPPSHQE